MEFTSSRTQIFSVLFIICVGVFVSVLGSTEAELQHRLRQMIPVQLIPVFSPSKVPSTEGYEVQIFSREPFILYIHNFVSTDEIKHLLALSENKYKESMIYPGRDAYVDRSQRVSETVELYRDEVVRRIERRARKLQGFRGSRQLLQPMKTQRYPVGGFYNFHFDWDPLVAEGNRDTTLMAYLVGNCTGGGTNFPRVPRPADKRWCKIIECEGSEDDDYDGVTFKPIEGSAVFWENMHPNGSLNTLVRHAGLPVKSGTKIGLNIWSWDQDWRTPEGDEDLSDGQVRTVWED
ncbi:putative prolyl 4-hydroxylase alpha subunit [Astrocystis sublimbata]|nr:putative prolyl 4-hydroxylase alpha subunit [Astrocystis sublimbata]